MGIYHKAPCYIPERLSHLRPLPAYHYPLSECKEVVNRVRHSLLKPFADISLVGCPYPYHIESRLQPSDLYRA